MAITSSAKKAIRSAARKRIFNLRRKRVVQNILNQAKKLLTQKKIDEAKALIPSVYRAIDKATKTKYIKKNKAARLKSRFTALIRRSSQIVSGR